MLSKTLISAARNLLKDMLSQCTPEEQHKFKRLYADENLDLPINEVVDKMEEHKLDWAIFQTERTIEKKS